jgi:carbon monoxide dehydrogenase subunit G
MTELARQFGGEEVFQADPSTLFAILTDLDSLAESIPDLVSAEKTSPRSLKCVVRPGFSFLRSTLRLVIDIDPLDPPWSAAMKVQAQGIGVVMQIVSQLRIQPEGSGSRLFWEARINEMTGLVATVSPGLVKAAADQTIRHGWQQVRKRLGE